MAISLIKGQKISLKKDDGSSLVDFCVGANWGAISKTGLFGNTKIVPVDLDLSLACFDSNKNLKNVTNAYRYMIFIFERDRDKIKYLYDDLRP